MPDYSMLISDLVVGNDYDFELSITEVPDGAELEDAWLTVKLYETDITPVIEKIINSTPLAGTGQIEDTGAGDNAGHLVFQLTHDDTLLLNPDRRYVFDCQVRTDTDKIYTIVKGEIIPIRRVTVATEP